MHAHGFTNHQDFQTPLKQSLEILGRLSHEYQTPN